MKALVFTATEEVTFRDEPSVSAGPGEALVRVAACGICGSDMHAYHGHDERRVPPLILGHEAVGEVVGGEHAGQLVALDPLITCGECPACRANRSNLCPERELIGMRRAGAFAELVAIPERNLIPLPEGMSLELAALAEPTAVALHAVSLGERAMYPPISESAALVIGGGAIGLLAALDLAWRGCPRIAVADTSALRRRVLEATGEWQVLDPLARDPGSDFDLVIDAVGAEATRQAAIRAAAPGGAVIHVGLLEPAGEADFRRMTLQEITFIGTYTYRHDEVVAAVHGLHEGHFGDLAWAETRPLAEGAEAFRDLHLGRSASPKIVLRP